MFYTIAEDLVFYQRSKFDIKYTNYELKLYQYFLSKTEGISPDFIIVIGNYILFFVKNRDY